MDPGTAGYFFVLVCAASASFCIGRDRLREELIKSIKAGADPRKLLGMEEESE